VDFEEKVNLQEKKYLDLYCSMYLGKLKANLEVKGAENHKLWVELQDPYKWTVLLVKVDGHYKTEEYQARMKILIMKYDY